MIAGTPPITAEMGDACKSWSWKSSGTAAEIAEPGSSLALAMSPFGSGHEPVGRQLPSGGLLVVAHDRGQQLQAGTQPGTGEGAQLVLGLGSSGGREVHHQPELVTVPHLVVAVKVTVHEHGRTRRREDGVGPVAPDEQNRPHRRPVPVEEV